LNGFFDAQQYAAPQVYCVLDIMEYIYGFKIS